MKRVILVVLIAAFAGGVRAQAMSAAVIKPKITVVQKMLDIVNIAHTKYHILEQSSRNFTQGTKDFTKTELAQELISWHKMYGEAIVVTEKVNSRIAKLLDMYTLVRLDGDALVSYKRLMEKRAIEQLFDEGAINFKEIKARLLFMYKQGADGYSESLLHLLEALD